MKYRFFMPLVVVLALIFIGCATETADVIQPTAIENIHFLPANIMLGNLDGRVPAEPMEDVASDQVLLKQTIQVLHRSSRRPMAKPTARGQPTGGSGGWKPRPVRTH